MPPLIVMAAVGAGVYFGLKYLAKEQRKSSARRKEKRSAAAQSNANAQTLKQDPKTGVYKVDD